MYMSVRENLGGLALERLQEGECEALLRRHYRKKLLSWWSARATLQMVSLTLSRHLPRLTETINKRFCKIHGVVIFLIICSLHLQILISRYQPSQTKMQIFNNRKTIISTNREPLGHPSGLAGYR